MRSDIPAKISPGVTTQAQSIWQRIAENLNFTGVLTVEFFLKKSGELLVNEIAPRVHNSGHVTQLVSPHCQFMAHVRAVMGLPLPDLDPIMEGSMWNLYPNHGLHDPQLAERYERELGGRILLYGKHVRPRRKMGHWLATAEQRSEVSKALESSL